MSTGPNPPLATLQQARARMDASLRWLRPAGPVVIILATWAAFRGHPAPGPAGHGLAISIALAAFALGGLGTLATRDRGGPVHLALIAVLLAGSASLAWLQPDGAAIIGLLAGVLFLGRSLPRRFEFPLILAGVVLLAAVAVTGRADSAISGLLGAIAIIGFFGVTFLARRLREANVQAEGILAELQQTRAGEARAEALVERQRLAREMHDVLAHSLSGLMLQLEGARMLAAGDPADPRLPEAIERAHRLAQAGLDEAGRAIGMLRGDELPGPERLPGLAARFQEDRGVPCQFTVSGQSRELSSEARLAVYRVAQEALTNIAKHARPERVELRLAYESDGTSLTVEDFAAPGPGPELAGGGGGGYGLTGMRERAELLGGELTAVATGTGFRVELRVPGQGQQGGQAAGRPGGQAGGQPGGQAGGEP